MSVRILSSRDVAGSGCVDAADVVMSVRSASKAVECAVEIADHQAAVGHGWRSGDGGSGVETPNTTSPPFVTTFYVYEENHEQVPYAPIIPFV